MSVALSVVMIAVVTALCCGVCGIFLVVRGQAMLSDAMSHGMLPGIVISAWIVGSINSLWLLVGATLMCMLVVVCAEIFRQTKLVSTDSAVGLLYPGLFAVGIILISTVFKKVHLHEDAVLEGDINIASINHWQVGTYDLGPKYFWLMLVVLLLNIIFIYVMWRPLVVSSFDSQSARMQGLPASLLNYSYMFVLSVTLTAAFKMAGVVLVVALLVVPAATARIVVTRIETMMLVTVFMALVGAIGGFALAYKYDLATSATMSMFQGLVFLGVFLGSRVYLRFHHYRTQQTALKMHKIS